MAPKSPDHTPDPIQGQYWLPAKKPHLLTCSFYYQCPVSPMWGRSPGSTDGLTAHLSVSQDQPRRLVALWPKQEAFRVPRPTTGYHTETLQRSAILDVFSGHRTSGI